ncbi:MAG: TlyA family RNA methyltransferase [Chloroflexi bacterium]|nr:TlyA family RNA methyltransferase [Chloroflexota bacterium]
MSRRRTGESAGPPAAAATRPAARRRLDILLVERGLAESRAQAQALVMAGAVRLHEEIAARAGQLVALDAPIIVSGRPPYVSRGGVKLAAALDAFGISVAGRVAVDVGASTGGFTDCLLQRGAARVYAVDVGYGQLDWRLRQDARVHVVERTNIRHLEALPEPVDLATIDVSFISLRLVLPAIERLLRREGDVVALVKPQFEAGRQQVRRGVVRDPAVHRQVLADLTAWCRDKGWTVRGVASSPLRGPAGNREFLISLRQP